MLKRKIHKWTKKYIYKDAPYVIEMMFSPLLAYYSAAYRGLTALGHKDLRR